MAIPKRKFQPKKDYGFMEEPPDIISATLNMDFDLVVACVEFDQKVIHQLDENGNNVMHICVSGGIERMKPFMDYFIQETDINLLHKNALGDNPLQLAFAINDKESADILYEPTNRQLTKLLPDDSPDLSTI